MMKRFLLIALGILVPQFTSAQGGFPPPGTLDTTFGIGGKVLTDFGGNADFASAIAAQDNGKIIVVGYSFVGSSADFALARYDRDGSLDTSFGFGGKVISDLGGFDLALAVAIQRDGKIVVTGSTAIGSGADLALVRYNPDGSLDPTFGSGGIVITDLGGFDQAHAVVIQRDGKIVVAGYSNAQGSYDFALVRYDRRGRLDTSFGTGGVTLVDFGGPIDTATAVAVQHDGKIIMAGSSNVGGGFAFALARCDPGGSLDMSFGTGGKVVTSFGGFTAGANGVALQANEKIVAAGLSVAVSSSDFALVRYNRDGTLDLSFGDGGKVVTDVGGDDGANAVAIQDDGRIVAAGASVANPPFGAEKFALARYDSNGTLDPSFGDGGKVLTSFGGLTELAYGLAIQEDGKIVAAGISDAAGSFDFALARYVSDEPSVRSPSVGVQLSIR